MISPVSCFAWRGFSRLVANEFVGVAQAVRVIRTHSSRDELATLSHVPYEPMPDELRRLLKELESVPTAHEKATPR